MSLTRKRTFPGVDRCKWDAETRKNVLVDANKIRVCNLLRLHTLFLLY